MKIFFTVCISFFLFSGGAYAQLSCPCCNTILETSAVSKPTDPGIVSATCSTLTVKWKGTGNQMYAVSAIYKSASVHEADASTAQGLLEKPQVTSYHYGTHTIKNQVATYALRSTVINLDQYINQTVTLIGKRISGYPVDGGPEYLEVLFVGPLSQTVQITAITCDNNQNCTAIIPVTPGTFVSWSVQAMAVIDGRTFSSYPLRGEQDYLIPSCDQPAATERAAASGATAKEQLVVSNEQLAMYPNPVNDALNIKLSSEYKGHVKLTIVDVSGKTVIAMNAEKQPGDYYNRISVSTLKPGVYFMNILMQNGKSFTTKFLKN